MDVNPDNAENIYYASLAGIGGGLGYMYRELRSKRKLRVVMAIMSCGVAAFVGFHMVFIFNALELNDNWKGAINGLTAFMGVEFMLAMSRKLIFKNLKVVPDKDLRDALLESGWREPIDSTANLDGVSTPEGSEAK